MVADCSSLARAAVNCTVGSSSPRFGGALEAHSSAPINLKGIAVIRTCLTTVSALFAASLTTAGSADVVEYTSLSNGQQSVSFSLGDVGIEAISSGGEFMRKEVAGVNAVGVSGGSVHGEIDGSEYIQFTFDEALTISSISVAHLYTAGNYGDSWNEAAMISTDRGDFQLEAISATSGTWSGSGAVYNDSAGVEGSGGAWTISGDDIFGGAVNWVRLSAGNAGGHGSYGDFGFVNMAAAPPIPTPGAAAMIVLATFVATGRRRRC